MSPHRSFTLIAFILTLTGEFSFDALAQRTGSAFPSRIPSFPTLAVGEDLTYEVSWSFVKLGTIRVKVTEKQIVSGETMYATVAHIDSYQGLLIPNIHAVFESIIDSEGYSRSFTSHQQKVNTWLKTRYDFDRKKKRVYIQEGFVTGDRTGPFTIEKRETLSVAERSLDGLSMLFYARVNVKSGAEQTVSTIINSQEMITRFNFFRRQGVLTIESIPHPVPVIEMEGSAEFEGMFGLGGPFYGWFTNDGAHIPLKGTMKIFLGSVRVELINWNRAGWKPSRPQTRLQPF